MGGEKERGRECESRYRMINPTEPHLAPGSQAYPLVDHRAITAAGIAYMTDPHEVGKELMRWL